MEEHAAPSQGLSHSSPSSQSVETAGSFLPITSLIQVRRKIAILGFGATVKDAPVGDPSWELWAMNGFWRAAKPDYGIDVPEERFARWFDMHSLDFTRAYGKAAGFDDAQERWLEKQHPFPIYMLEAAPQFPSVVAFPIEDLVAKLRRDYFTSSVAYALAMAVAQDFVDEIGLWGIDLAHDTEYSSQRPCAEYWIGRAEAAGILVTIHEDSALLKQRVRYGYEDENPLLGELRGWLQNRGQELQAAQGKHGEDMEKLRIQMHTDDGALQIVRSALERLDMWERGGKV